MQSSRHLPSITLVRALTAGGPFAVGDTVSVAFTDPSVGRLLHHGAATPHADLPPERGVVPDAISACVLFDAEPYASGDVVTLSFVDARFARIHPTHGNDARPTATRYESLVRNPPAAGEPPNDAPKGVRVRFEWNAQRARRFVQMSDKLFTVERLGWYRHVLAMRFLVPDEIQCGTGVASERATAALQLLRVATIETLGRPLLAACMPNFSVTPEWLDSVDSPGIARALAELRTALLPFARDEADFEPIASSPTSSLGIVSASDITGSPAASSDALLAALLPSRAADPILSERLAAYRTSLADIFAQTARSTEAVRVGRMSESNHVLDDRLWQLVGSVGDTLGGHADR